MMKHIERRFKTCKPKVQNRCWKSRTKVKDKDARYKGRHLESAVQIKKIKDARQRDNTSDRQKIRVS